ncbi:MULTISPECIES: hypothetical protein [Enterobacter cloacae complex]|nr:MULTISPECIES: hypothetical protein [Enterobacter cloacae complex]MCY0771850.1 hypothetical protein [Enterobacter cloacae complex sp. 2022EL-00788]MDE4081348.1 hypothetical protein [Enterobacter pasteurii]
MSTKPDEVSEAGVTPLERRVVIVTLLFMFLIYAALLISPWL